MRNYWVATTRLCQALCWFTSLILKTNFRGKHFHSCFPDTQSSENQPNTSSRLKWDPKLFHTTMVGKVMNHKQRVNRKTEAASTVKEKNWENRRVWTTEAGAPHSKSEATPRGRRCRKSGCGFRTHAGSGSSAPRKVFAGTVALEFRLPGGHEVLRTCFQTYLQNVAPIPHS